MPDGLMSESPLSFSMRAQIASLQLNEIYSRSERIDFNTCTRDDLRDILESLRNTISPAVARARKQTGHEYMVEGGEWRTHDRDIIVTMCVTRTA